MVVARHTMQLGALLTILGAGTFGLMAGFMPGEWTALQPAFFGIAFLGLGFVALKREAWQRPLLHAAVGLALLAVAGMLPGLVQSFALLGGGAVAHPTTAVQHGMAALICLGFVSRAAALLFTARP